MPHVSRTIVTFWACRSHAAASLSGAAACGAHENHTRAAKARRCFFMGWDSIPSGLLTPLLPEPEDVAVDVLRRELLHVIVGLHGGAVRDARVPGPELVVERLGVGDPEERVPRPALLFVRADARRIGDAPQHHSQAVAAQDGELERRAGGVVA